VSVAVEVSGCLDVADIINLFQQYLMCSDEFRGLG